MLATMNNHDSKCSGCPCCDETMAASLSMSPREYVAWAKSQAQAMRSNSASGRTFRSVNLADAPLPTLPPRGYSLAVAKLHAAEKAVTTPAPAPADSTLAPRPYSLALAKVGKGAILESEIVRTEHGNPRPYETAVRRNRRNRTR